LPSNPFFWPLLQKSNPSQRVALYLPGSFTARLWSEQIIYPLAEQVIPVIMSDDIIAGYTAAEARTAADFTAKYEVVVVGYEQE
jgi:hypothetical protein